MKHVTAFILTVVLTVTGAVITSANGGFDQELARKINDGISQGPDNGHFQIDAATLAQWIKEGRKDFQVIDARVGEGGKGEEVLFNKAHIPGAIYIPYHELFKPDNLKKLDKTRTIIVACHMGATEELVIVPLRMLGYQARALLLGMSGWQKDYPTQNFVRGLMDTANKGEFPVEGAK